MPSALIIPPTTRARLPVEYACMGILITRHKNRSYANSFSRLRDCQIMQVLDFESNYYRTERWRIASRDAMSYRSLNRTFTGLKVAIILVRVILAKSLLNKSGNTHSLSAFSLFFPSFSFSFRIKMPSKLCVFYDNGWISCVSRTQRDNIRFLLL